MRWKRPKRMRKGERSEAEGCAESLARQGMLGRRRLWFGVAPKNGFEQLVEELVEGGGGTARGAVAATALVDLMSEEGLESGDAGEAGLGEAAAQHGSVEVSLEGHPLELVQQIALLIAEPLANLRRCLHCCL
ncbi:hypothetical protein QN277_010718 [Acacia crassicarpa]|uniref:Uncharacterized protein n=1 Tax=Acacia crassicarpa TaxID=499986 RepID=A0AAE1IM73_9FABA|nr:hypothetical protein QN277_010718 [Acacia crassicarpa]